MQTALLPTIRPSWTSLNMSGRGEGWMRFLLSEVPYGGVPHCEVQYIVGNGHMGCPPLEQNDRQTGLKTLLSRNYVGGL